EGEGVLEHRQRRRRPGAGRGGDAGDLGDLRVVDVIEALPVLPAEEAEVRDGRPHGGVVGEDRFEVVVQVLDVLAGRQGAPHAHARVDVPDDGDAALPRLVDDGVV